MRLVLDSNVWLDWLVFDDPRVAPLKRAWRSGWVEIVIDPPCRGELVRVLGYEQFKLDASRKDSLLGEADHLTTFLANLTYPPEESLPPCSDPDDIKFLALSAASRADWLITKDKVLLSVQRRKHNATIPFRIATPEQWTRVTQETANVTD